MKQPKKKKGMTVEQLAQKVELLEREINAMKQDMVDIDKVLTRDDLKAIEQGEKEYRLGKTKRL